MGDGHIWEFKDCGNGLQRMEGAKSGSVLSIGWNWEGSIAQTISRSAKGGLSWRDFEAELGREFIYVDDQSPGPRRRKEYQTVLAKTYAVTQENPTPQQPSLSTGSSHTQLLNWKSHLRLFNSLKYVQRKGPTQQIICWFRVTVMVKMP